jgi:hypothetical protein
MRLLTALSLLTMTSIAIADSFKLQCSDVSMTIQIGVTLDETYQSTGQPALERIVLLASNSKSKKISFLPEGDFARRIEQNAIIIPFISEESSEPSGYTDLLAVARYDSNSNRFVGAISQVGRIFPLSCAAITE